MIAVFFDSWMSLSLYLFPSFFHRMIIIARDVITFTVIAFVAVVKVHNTSDPSRRLILFL